MCTLSKTIIYLMYFSKHSGWLDTPNLALQKQCLWNQGFGFDSYFFPITIKKYLVCHLNHTTDHACSWTLNDVCSRLSLSALPCTFSYSFLKALVSAGKGGPTPLLVVTYFFNPQICFSFDSISLGSSGTWLINSLILKRKQIGRTVSGTLKS